MSMKEMKQMPYKVEEGAIERAKYRAKMAVREVAHPTEHRPFKVRWRWASAVAMVAVVVVGVIGFMKLQDNVPQQTQTPMDKLVAQMQNAPDEVISDLAVDVCYYLEDEYSL